MTNPYLEGCTGRNVRVAIIDSGVHAGHPHIGGITSGFAVDGNGIVSGDFVDTLGHGTAVAAVIREKAPDTELVAVKVFWDRLATSIETLCQAIERAAEQGAQVINLSLGTNQPRHRASLEKATAAAAAHGAILVAAHDDGGARWLPGSLDGVIAVRADWTIDRRRYAVGSVEGRGLMLASPYPRDIPGVPRERNVHGVSFAVANASAFVARALEAAPGSDLIRLFAVLGEGACAAHIA